MDLTTASRSDIIGLVNREGRFYIELPIGTVAIQGFITAFESAKVEPTVKFIPDKIRPTKYVTPEDL